MSPAEERHVQREALRRATVLVVEDETLLRLAAAEHLRAGGFVVIEAATGEEAQAVLKSGVSVDLIFSDINMPGALDGVELAVWVAAQEWAPPLLLTSGIASVLDAARAACPSVLAFLAKPYPYEEMERAIRSALPKRAL
jgi:DNA-binding NtrC family response regulator